MRLWVIRHAEAEHPAGRHDHERLLSPAGRSQASRLARYLSHRSTAAAIVSSPVLRARETAEAIHNAVASSTLTTSDAVSTSGSAREAIDVIRKLHVPECIIVSHEPLTSQLVARLATGDDALHVHFTPATAVLLDLGAHVRIGHAHLVECISPDTLQHISVR